MDIKAFINTGILENYCLGLCTEAEKAEIVLLVQTNPQVKTELARVEKQYQEMLFSRQVKPAASLKSKIMQAVYRDHAQQEQSFPPLIDDRMAPAVLSDWLALNDYMPAGIPEGDDIVVKALPSTDLVVNFIAVTKCGHVPEVHFDFVEYLYIIQGSCSMDFEGIHQAYHQGDVIKVSPSITHTAVVTSKEPMIALVQRQMA